MNKIEICNISFSYDEKNVFKDFFASFPAGCTSVIMGTSGCGKTTLLYLMAKMLKITSGTIKYPWENPKFSFVFQDERLIENLSVEGHIKLINPKIIDKDIVDCLEKLGIEKMKKKKVKALSGGERQRVAIARALLCEYDILFLDEPFTGLDDETKDKVMECVKDMTKDKTVIMVTHDKEEAKTFIKDEKLLYYI